MFLAVLYKSGANLLVAFSGLMIKSKRSPYIETNVSSGPLHYGTKRLYFASHLDLFLSIYIVQTIGHDLYFIVTVLIFRSSATCMQPGLLSIKLTANSLKSCSDRSLRPNCSFRSFQLVRTKPNRPLPATGPRLAHGRPGAWKWSTPARHSASCSRTLSIDAAG